MKTPEILSILALIALGLCLLCGLVKKVVKESNAKKRCDDACSLLVFLAVVLVGISQLITEEGFNVSSTSECSGNSCCRYNWDESCNGKKGCKWIYSQSNPLGECVCKKCNKPLGSDGVIANYPLTGADTCKKSYPCCIKQCCKENYKYCNTTCSLAFWNPNCLGDCLKQRGLCGGACRGQNIGCTS